MEMVVPGKVRHPRNPMGSTFAIIVPVEHAPDTNLIEGRNW
jgi:hypothetical protein